MNEFLKEVAKVAKVAAYELAVVLFCTVCVLVPVALWYTGVLP